MAQMLSSAFVTVDFQHSLHMLYISISHFISAPIICGTYPYSRVSFPSFLLHLCTCHRGTSALTKVFLVLFCTLWMITSLPPLFNVHCFFFFYTYCPCFMPCTFIFVFMFSALWFVKVCLFWNLQLFHLNEDFKVCNCSVMMEGSKEIKSACCGPSSSSHPRYREGGGMSATLWLSLCWNMEERKACVERGSGILLCV